VGEEDIFDFEGEDVFASYKGQLPFVLFLGGPRMMISLMRPVMERYPSLSIEPSSPVNIHSVPSSSRTMTSLVFASFFQYPIRQISPEGEGDTFLEEVASYTEFTSLAKGQDLCGPGFDDLGFCMG
jgi:hypothetical protein